MSVLDICHVFVGATLISGPHPAASAAPFLLSTEWHWLWPRARSATVLASASASATTHCPLLVLHPVSGNIW
jgi:hypothetical protein